MPWAGEARGGRRARTALALTAAVLLVCALVLQPLPAGDALEYLLQTESLARHASPEVRAGDVLSLARQDARLHLGLDFAAGYRGYFDDPDGHWYACHFWAYSLLAVPARLALAALGINGLRAFPLTSTAVFLLALHHVLFVLPFGARWRVTLFLLLLASPALFFLRWPHAEAINVAILVLALTLRYARRPIGALLCAAVASLQAPPFVVILALLWGDAVSRDARWPTVWRASAAASLGLLSPLFYLAHFGTPSLLAQESTSLANASVGRAAQLFVDPNLGLVRAMPLTVLLLAASVVWVLLRCRTMPFEAGMVVTIGLMAFACAATDNWNHDTIGPSRYAVWLLPCVLFLVVRTADAAPVWTRGALLGTALAAAASQAVLVAAAGGPLAQPDSLRHSAAARLVLRYAPALYQPDESVFAARTLRQPRPAPGLVVYEDAGRCRKALASAADEPALLARCGSVPASGFRASGGALDRRYVDY